MARSPRSKRFRALERELNQIRMALLPRRFNATGLYPDGVFVRTVAYRLLAHAEMEAYLEDRAWAVSLEAVAAMKRGMATRAAVCLVAFSGVKSELPPDSVRRPKDVPPRIWDPKTELCAKLDAAACCFHVLMEGNNGIRERDLVRLLLPVGVNIASLDSAWLASMDSYGDIRGSYAHKSATVYRAKSKPDPKSELLTIKNLLVGLREIDDQLNALSK